MFTKKANLNKIAEIILKTQRIWSKTALTKLQVIKNKAITNLANISNSYKVVMIRIKMECISSKTCTKTVLTCSSSSSNSNNNSKVSLLVKET